MGDFFRWSPPTGDYEQTTGRGKNKRTVGRVGDTDYVRERNWGSGPGKGCGLVLLAGALPALAAAAELARQVLS